MLGLVGWLVGWLVCLVERGRGCVATCASRSSAESCATKAHTSAMLTATSIQPSRTKVTLMASSMSWGAR